MTSISITFLASRLFPGDVDPIRHSWGYFDLSAMSGPKLEPGAQGDVIGDRSGFFGGTNYGGDLDVSAEGTETQADRRPSKKRTDKKLLKKTKEMDPNYQLLKERRLSGK